MRTVRRGLRALPEPLQANVAACLDVFHRILEPQLLGETVALLDEAIADLYNCARARAALGTGAAFFEMQFRVHGAGGWPCGWRGEYPAGAMLGYFLPALDGQSGRRSRASSAP